MDHYSYSIPCGVCGKKLILTGTEVEYHYRHCHALEMLDAEIIDDENAIRTYGDGQIGYLTAVYHGGSGIGWGGVMLVTGESTVLDIAGSPAMFRLLTDCPDAKTDSELKVDEDMTDDMLLPSFGCRSKLSEIYGFSRIAGISYKGLESPVFIKRCLTVRIGREMTELARLLAEGEVPYSDFFSVGYFFDQFCNDAQTLKASEFADYMNDLVRFTSTETVIGARAMDGNGSWNIPDSLSNNFMDYGLVADFRSFLGKKSHCDGWSAADTFRNFTVGQLKKFCSIYKFRTTGAKKEDMVRFLAEGGHVERGLTEMINVYEYDVLQDIMDCDGFMPVPDGQLDSAYIRLFELGLAFAGHTSEYKLVIFIPREFLFLYRRLLNDPRAQAWYDERLLLERRLNGIMYAYGVLTSKKLFSVYKKIFGKLPLDPAENEPAFETFSRYLWTEYGFWSQRTSVGRLFIAEREDFIYHENFWTPMSISRRTVARSLRPLTAEEAEAHGSREDDDYVPAFDGICADILYMLSMDDDDAQNGYMYMYNLMLYGLMQGASPENVFEVLTRKLPLPFERVKYILDILKTEAQYIRVWKNGGYSADELAKMEEKKRPNIKMSFKKK